MKKILLILIVLTTSIYGQQDKSVNQVQPKIMVVPHTKEGEDIRTVLENDFNKRIAISTVKEAFGRRGFNTIDFTQKLKNALNDMALNSDTKTDAKTQFIQLSGADIYVDTEVFVQKSSSGNSVKLILEARDAFTGESLANKSGDSGKFYTDDIAKLSKKAVEGCIEDFLNVMNQSFGRIVKDGRSVMLTLMIDQNSDYSFNDEIGNDGDLLSEVIEDWLDENSYKNYFHVQGVTDNKMIIDDFRIPLRDARGKNFRPSKVLRKLRKFVRGLGLHAKNGTTTMGKMELIIQ